MKRILALTFCLGLALTQVVHAEDKDKKHAKKAANAAAVTQHNANVAHMHNAQIQHNAQIHHNAHVQQNLNAQHIHKAQIKQANTAAALNAHATAQQYKHGNHANTIVDQNNHVVTGNKIVVRNRNSWAEARRFDWHQHHDHDWWRHNYSHTRFVIFGGGYYFWNNGYWYPAYGYDPAYSRYEYDEPIYGYNQLSPSDVISNVQGQLQQQGYYEGDIDGSLGPMTRNALARYQEDNGLVVTRAIDEPTLEALGLT